MPMQNLIECILNYSEATGSLQFYSADEATNYNAGIVNNDTFKSFEYKGKLLGNTKADRTNGILKKVKIAFPLKYLVIFSRSF